MNVRFGTVVIIIPRISLVMFCGNPNGSQYRKWGSFVPAGLYSPMVLFMENNCWPKGVIGGALGSCAFPRGTAMPELGPAQVPVRSSLGAGPPSPIARSVGKKFHVLFVHS